MKKKITGHIPAVRKETLHKILYALMLQRAAKQKAARTVIDLVVVED